MSTTNPKLTNCKACGGTVAISAPRCPHCGDIRGLREQITKRSKRGLKILFGLVGALFVGGIIIAAIQDHEASAGFEIGKSYEVTEAAWVCATVEGLSLTSKDSLVGSEGFTNTLVEGRKAGCNPIFPETYHVVILEKDAALVKVRIVCRNEAANQFEGWTEAENIKPANAP